MIITCSTCFKEMVCFISYYWHTWGLSWSKKGDKGSFFFNRIIVSTNDNRPDDQKCSQCGLFIILNGKSIE